MTSLQSVKKDFTAVIRHKEGNIASFFYIIYLFGDGDGRAAAPPPSPRNKPAAVNQSVERH